jgi:hypothetical protein
LWSDVTGTALVVIPEEAELLYPLIRDTKDPFTHLLTYAAPVTRKMLHFNNLGYYAVPTMPTGWKPPTWLTIELGIFAGRLYFEFEEYGDLCKYLGLDEDDAKLLETSDDAVPSTELYGTDGAANDTANGAEKDKSILQTPSFTTNPLTFLQEWLAIKRKGQDFTHTPMGYLCHGKPLTASHPFFTRFKNDGAPKSNTTGLGHGQEREESVGVSGDGDVASNKDYEDDDFLDEEGGD